MVRATLAIGGNATIEEYYHSLFTEIGVETQQSATIAANQTLLVSHLNAQRESVSGVSLDEEQINLIKYQHAYEASARMITMADELIDRVINRMSRTGI